MGAIFLVLLLLMDPGVLGTAAVKDIVVIILSQENEHHLEVAENLKKDLLQQAEVFEQGFPPVHLSHLDFPHLGGWTVLPLIPRILDLHRDNSSWVVIVEDRTKINLKNLINVLKQHDEGENLWLGHALHDAESSVIHHFAFYEDPTWFKYPNLASGVAFTTQLLISLSARLRENPAHSDFAIDSSHELALFIWNKGTGQTLQHEPALCIKEEPHCAAFPTPFQQCGELVDKNSIYFAVKTCRKYHKDRVAVVKKTWAEHATNIKFFSDFADKEIPTVDLGVPNTEFGHCSKTVAILRYVNKELKQKESTTGEDVKWIVVVDDDTILSVSRLQKLLTCYDASTPVALGERYGYNVHNSRGYNYITGGGGMVFSRVLLEVLSKSCECPSIESPDDMYLGVCIDRLGVGVTHSPLFHQARPSDYSPGYLQTKDAVSFHKHWMIDPVVVYDQWFGEEDLKSSWIYDGGFDEGHTEL